MSLLNGLSAFGGGLKSYTANLANDEAENAARGSLLNSAPPAATTPAAQPPPRATSYGDPSLPGPRMPAGPNPYGDNPHAAALWAAEQAIKGPESGGKADAQNPISSAGGLFQITDGTFSNALEKMGVTPPKSKAELDAMKYNPETNTSVMRTINSDAAAALDKAGLPVTVATLQAAHRLGVGGAITAIKTAIQDPNAPLVGNGLDPTAARGNGDISGLTVAGFLGSPYPRAKP